MKNLCFFIALISTFSAKSQLTVFDTITSGGLERDFRMYIPASYDGSEAVPLVLNLHGYSSDNFGQALYANFNPVADTAGFITVLPNGTIDGFGFRYWNCFISDGIGVDDVQFISDLIDSISATYHIDPNRIYSTGMSNGGFMSHTLACELSDKIAAIASVAGVMSKARLSTCNAEHNMPVMQIHGTADPTVPYDGNADWVSADSIVKYWAGHNHCNAEPTFSEVPDVITTDLCTAEHYIYGGCYKGITTELYKIIGGEHTWPGTAIIFLGVTNQDINACAEIWKFFSRYRLDELTAIDENNGNEIHDMYLQPNPFANAFTLQIDPEMKIHQVSVYDYTGRIIFSTTDLDQTNLILNTENWMKGIYIVSLQSENGTVNKQVVKM